MENRNNIVRMLAFVLFTAMLVSVFASCGLVNPNVTTPTTVKPDGPHICEFGPWKLVQEATATKDGLSERKCEECGKVEQKVIPASVKEYTITYVDAPRHNNPTKYTVNDYIDLQKAVWNGLSFAYWTDKDGNIVDEISYGTEGNITLYANWKSIENMVVSSKNNDVLLTIYNQEADTYQFVYKLGTIYNVVLDELSSYRYSGVTNHTWTISETVSFTESSANNVASTIANTVTSSSSWTKTVSATQDSSSSTSASVSTELSAGWGETKASIGGTISGTSNSGTSDTTSNCNSGSVGSSSQESQSVSSTISYVQDTTTQVTRSEELQTSFSPAGMYKYAQAGSVDVFAIITYDSSTKNYYINIYSCIFEIYETMLYEPIPEYNGDIHMVESDPFEFDIDVDALAENINNAYYIEFDANGGKGSMPTQMMLPNTEMKLIDNQFTKEGYVFIGWRIKDGDKTNIYIDGHKIKNLGSPKETVVLEAVWSRTGPVYSEWSEWSEWSFERRETNELVREESAQLWTYYYFQCPTCGVHMHVWRITCPTWAGGCGKGYIPENSHRFVFSEKSYSEAGVKDWYGTGKYYAYIDGQLVFQATHGKQIVYRYSSRTVINE